MCGGADEEGESVSGSHRNFPRRTDEIAAKVFHSQCVPADGAGIRHGHAGDAAPGDPTLKAGPDNLNFGQFRH